VILVNDFSKFSKTENLTINLEHLDKPKKYITNPENLRFCVNNTKPANDFNLEKFTQNTVHLFLR